jgi:hypothetical protein
MLTRVYGRPTEHVEIEAISETEEDIDRMIPEERKALLIRLERETGGSLLKLVHED